MNGTVMPHDCGSSESSLFPMLLAFVALPIHVMIIKTLVKDLRLDIPRHSIVLSLSISDATLVSILFILDFIEKIATVELRSSGCLVYRGILLFLGSSMTVVSSLSIIALSVERYIACMHSFQLHQIITESRVRGGSIVVWTFGVLVGVLVTITSRYDDALIITYPNALQYIYPVLVIPTSFAVIIVQLQLFLLSRRKMNKPIPAGAVAADVELAHSIRKHLKLAFMTGVGAFFYLVCMLPITYVFLYELLSGDLVSSTKRGTFFMLSFSNSLANPLIYGLGVADTRNVIIRDLRRMKQFVINCLPGCICQTFLQTSNGKVHHLNENVLAINSINSTKVASPLNIPPSSSFKRNHEKVEQVSSL